MQLNGQTVDILKNFSAINSNLVINVGNKIETISASKDIIAVFESDEDFTKQISIFNLNEFLGVLNAFDKPDLELNDKNVVVSQGNQKVKYNYADSSLLIVPPEKGVKFPATDIAFTLADVVLAKLLKMAAILSAEDLAIIGDGENITIKIFDKKNSLSNTFVLDVETETTETFQVNFKIDKFKLVSGTYDVEISSKKISKFSHAGLSLIYYIAVESDSTFA
jgi:hypothetical protein